MDKLEQLKKALAGFNDSIDAQIGGILNIMKDFLTTVDDLDKQATDKRNIVDALTDDENILRASIDDIAAKCVAHKENLAADIEKQKSDYLAIIKQEEDRISSASQKNDDLKKATDKGWEDYKQAILELKEAQDKLKADQEVVDAKLTEIKAAIGIVAESKAILDAYKINDKALDDKQAQIDENNKMANDAVENAQDLQDQAKKALKDAEDKLAVAQGEIDTANSIAKTNQDEADRLKAVSAGLDQREADIATTEQAQALRKKDLDDKEFNLNDLKDKLEKVAANFNKS